MTTEFLYSELTTKDIIIRLSSFILELKNGYGNYFSDDEFNKFLVVNIERGLEIYIKGLDVEFEPFFRDLLLNNLLNEVNTKELLKLNKVIKFIEDKIDLSNSLYVNVNNIKRIKKYINKTKLEVDFEKMQKLVNDSPKFNTLLNSVVAFINDNQNDEIIATDSSLIEFLEDYCSVKEILLHHNENHNDFVNDSVKQYFNELAKYPVLTDEESHELEKRMVLGDKEARKKLIEHNLRLVIIFAKRYQNRGLDFQDLIQQGNWGLIEATKKFNINKGVKFSSFASFWIRQKINKGLNYNARTIRKPAYLEQLFNKITRTENNLCLDLGREPSDKEVAEALNINVEKLQCLKSIKEDVSSLNALVDDENAKELIACLRTNDDTETEAERDIIKYEFLNNYLEMGLTEREFEILKYRYGFYDGKIYTLRELAPLYDVSHERIKQLEQKAIVKLQKYYNDNGNLKRVNRKTKKRQAS